MTRLFVAVWPPPSIVERLAALPRPAVEGLRWTRPDQWHVTLRFLGSVEDVDGVATALASVFDEAPVEATVGPEVQRFGHRVLHVPVDGLAGLASAVVRLTAHLGEPPEDRPFAGHLTLARAGNRARRVDLRPLTGAPISGRWPVAEVTLVASRPSGGAAGLGARYEVLSCFPLSDAGR